MGILSWLFPSHEDRMDKAEGLLRDQEFGQARLELMGLEGERAEGLRAQAHEGLKQANIREALGLAAAGRFEAAQEHIQLAQEFSETGDHELRGARRRLREIRAEQREQAKAARPSPQAAGPLGTNPALAGGWQVPGEGGAMPGAVEGGDPIFSLPPSDPRVRYALLLEQYPEDLRSRFVALGADFATAVLAIEDGHGAHAVDVLAPFVDQDEAARFERARAASLADDHALVIQDLAAFAAAFGHRQVGQQHTVLMMANSLARQGDQAGALALIEAQLVEEPKSAPLLVNRALLLEAVGRFAEADELARQTVKTNSRQMVLYKLMARCRLRAGKRLEAMQALEAGLTTNCTSGKCGSLPFDVEAGRQLAQLYLEDRLEPARAAELIGRIKGRLEQPSWFEGYLDALVARNAEDGAMLGMVKALSVGVRPGDPRSHLLNRSFPGALPQLTG
jgi:tetratricopeptide (TPR) repeat protein